MISATAFLSRLDSALHKIERKRPWLSRQTGIPLSTINSWFARNRYPRADHVYKIAKALSTTVEEIMNEKKRVEMGVGDGVKTEDHVGAGLRPGSDNERLRPVVPFKDKAALNREEWMREFEGVREQVKDAVLVWRDEERDVWFLPMEMDVSTCVGLLEIAKSYVIDNYQ